MNWAGRSWRQNQGHRPQDPQQRPAINSNLAYLPFTLVVPRFNEKTNRSGPSSPLIKLRSSKHFKIADLAGSLCTISMHNKGRVGESTTYFSTKTSGFIRVSCSRKAKGNKTQRNTNKDSHYQPFKYTDHTLVAYTEKKGNVHFTHFGESTFSSTKASHQSFSGQTTLQTRSASKLPSGFTMNFRCCVI